MELFGFELKRKKEKETLETFAIERDTTAEGVMFEGMGGIHAHPWESTQLPTEQIELIRTYRRLAKTSEIDEALQEIRNEIFIFDVPGERAFELMFTEETGSPSVSIQKKIQEEFKEIYQIMDFHNRGIQYFEDWYVDSRLVLHKIIDANHPKEGIQRIDFIDPLNIRKIRIIPKPDRNGIFDVSKIREFYVYAQNFDNRYNFSRVTDVQFGTSVQGLQINPDVITFVDSGHFDREMGRYIGYLDKAVVPYNNLKMMEEAMLIFRVVRAPMRRAIYIDVASMQKNKADQYMKDMMSRFKNKMVYDSKTGQLMDRRNILSMMEDYWLPRRDGGKGTEIQTLDGADSQHMLEEVEYYRDRLWRALNVPKSRFGEQAQSFIFGKGIEIQRDEYRFKKFLDLLRQRFMRVIEDILKTQLVLKNVIIESEWDELRRFMFWQYAEDNAFVEFKESELISNRINMLQAVDPFVGKYFSAEWVRRKILRQSEEEIMTEDERMKNEPAPLQPQIDQANLEAAQATRDMQMMQAQENNKTKKEGKFQ